MNSPSPPNASRWLAYLACGVAIIGVAAVWTGASLMTNGLCAWIAVLAALDAALLLRLANWPPGRSRARMALTVLALTIVCAGYFIATAQIGRTMGMRPHEALPRMSVELAALYLRSNLAWTDLIWLAAAAITAWRGGK